MFKSYFVLLCGPFNQTAAVQCFDLHTDGYGKINESEEKITCDNEIRGMR